MKAKKKPVADAVAAAVNKNPPQKQATREQQLAVTALRLINSATAPADDNTQQAIIETKRFLAGIANGVLIVTPAPTTPAAPAPATK